MTIYQVLVVDDSAFMRKSICDLVERHPSFEVVGRARNGKDALQKIERWEPDLVIVDIEMPEMDGLHLIEEIMLKKPIPFICISNHVEKKQQAMEQGAISFLWKEDLFQDEAQIDLFHEALLLAIKQIPMFIQPIIEEQIEPVFIEGDQRLLIFGSSTGGPAALQKILKGFPPDFPVPIIIIQHIPVGFTKGLANRFDQICSLKVKEMENGEMLLPGFIYVAPAGLQTVLHFTEVGRFEAHQIENEHQHILYKPSINVTLDSIQKNLMKYMKVVILTGMGDDGLEGCINIHKNGGEIFGQSKDTCVIYGMPKVVEEAQILEKQIDLDHISKEMIDIYMNTLGHCDKEVLPT